MTSEYHRVQVRLGPNGSTTGLKDRGRSTKKRIMDDIPSLDVEGFDDQNSTKERQWADAGISVVDYTQSADEVTINAEVITTETVWTGPKNDKPVTLYRLNCSLSVDGTVVKRTTCYRRYNAFYNLHQRIEAHYKKYPDISLPELPPKRFFVDHMDPIFISDRKIKLNRYIRNTTFLPDAFKIFELMEFMELGLQPKSAEEEESKTEDEADEQPSAHTFML